MEGWDLGKTVPDFEKFIRKFYGTELGFGVCNDGVKLGTVKQVPDERSKYYASSYTSTAEAGKDIRFICDKSLKRWRVATDIEKDTAGWGYGSSASYKDGDMKNGKINTSNMYVYEDGKWRDATSTETDKATACLTADALVNKVVPFDGVKFICKSGHNWSSAWSDFPDNKFFNESISYDSLKYAGQTYRTVKIGTQTWMAENLNYDPGDVSGMGSYAWHGCYGGDTANCSRYGRLYTWEVAVNDASCAYGNTCSLSGAVRGICPENWHIPSKPELETLLDVTGKKIRANNWLADDDVFGFSLLPAGSRGSLGYFNYVGSRARLWSFSECSSVYAFYLSVDGSDAYTEYSSKFDAFSVRCVRNSN